MEKKAIKLHNTLTGKKDIFEPLDKSANPKIGMYVCGPTVYDRAHIGNARAVVVFDVLYRLLRHEYGTENVIYVRNITDVDDKINAAAKAQNLDSDILKAIDKLTKKTTKMFHDDMAALNCLSPNHEPLATENIDGMIEMCETLIKKSHAYAAEGHVLFSVESYEKYGDLSHRSRDEMIAGARVEIAPYKKNPADFVLWKPSKDDEPGWDSPWGRGRPGWHIECSVMSTKYLGETFDIHGGGADLKFPHHENEIAQSCCAFPGSEFAKYWMHNGFLSVEGEKMSKSLGNFITVRDLLDKGVNGEVIRYALLSSHYSSPLDWNEKIIYDSKLTMDKFYKIYENKENIGDKNSGKIMEFIADDLNTAMVFAYLNEKAGEYNSSKSPKASEELVSCLKQLGFLQQSADEYFGRKSGADEVDQFIQARLSARAAKNWAESDRIRDDLKAKGIILEDKPDGTTTWKRA